jgi:2-polyprenyl-6-methoxyphenol hydroxylase-like FAD-dependent oxidoreductase
MRIAVDDLSGPEIEAFLQKHVDQMRSLTPLESVHALDLDALREPGITFWSAYDDDRLVGCGAVKPPSPATSSTLNALPIGHRWERVPGVTLLGDAAHLSPPNGEGADLAMLDGARLGQALAAHPDDLEAALTEYEQALFPRSTEEAIEAARDFEICFGANTPQSLIGLFTAHQPPA